MSNKKILIVVGAGASKEANLPTGEELKWRIIEILDIYFDRGKRYGDPTLWEAIKQVSRKGPPSRDIEYQYLETARKIRNALPLAISVDNFINDRKGDKKIEVCGKLAIVRSILEAERKSILFFKPGDSTPGPNFRSLNGTWFIEFRKLLLEDCLAEQLEKRFSTIQLIVFNYDRCIEHFLYHSLQAYYGIDEKRASELVQKIEIYHPYGTIGKLPWCCRGGQGVEFGAIPAPSQLVSLGGEIKTFTEGINPQSSNIEAIRTGMAEAQIVLFLGFAYHSLNLDLLWSPGNSQCRSRAHFFGTALGESQNNRRKICLDLARRARVMKTFITVDDLTCFQLFKNYWRSFSFS